MTGKLTIVPTPIGNLEDITLRAINALKDADIVLAEDTRTTGKLLKHYEIDSTMQSYHMHNEHKRTDGIVEELLSGKQFALVSDAGTPGVSDPGFLLVRACIENNIEVITLPGATAFVPALVSSGLPCDRFLFEGFLPQKKGRQGRIERLAEEERTLVFYESPHRIVKALEQFEKAFGADRKCCVSREISKVYEEHVRGTLAEALAHFKANNPKGEFVVIVEGKSK